MAKILIITGLVIMFIGVILYFLPGEGLPRLPGDIYIKKEHSVFYFPLGWCILISIVLTLVFKLFGK